MARFNPTQVRLRRDCPTGKSYSMRRFNPTQVRLRLGADSKARSPGWFQSHTGTITTRGPAASIASPLRVSIPHRYDYDIPDCHPVLRPIRVSIPHRYDYDRPARTAGFSWGAGFNPTQVRLRPLCPPLPKPFSPSVSIPHRYDYDNLPERPPVRGNMFQSHTGTITTRSPDGAGGGGEKFQSHTGTITTQYETS